VIQARQGTGGQFSFIMITKELIKKWKGNRRYSLKIIEGMPEEYFDFKPASGVKSFKSQASHITTWMRTQSRFVTGITMDKPSTKTKEEILHYFTEFFDTVLAYLEKTSEEGLSEIVTMWYGKVSKESVLLTMDNHLSHHRGQMIVYLRLKGIKPPGYVGW